MEWLKNLFAKLFGKKKKKSSSTGAAVVPPINMGNDSDLANTGSGSGLDLRNDSDLANSGSSSGNKPPFENDSDEFHKG